MKDFEIIDNFLDPGSFLKIQELILFNENFPFYLHKEVTYDNEVTPNWSWYGVHILYKENVPNSNHFKTIYDTFIPKISELVDFKSLLRIKVNFYPHTNTIHEHTPHSDLPFDHYGAVFSLNTCNGFTKLNNEHVIDSVENRLLLFNPHIPHNSSTTTDFGRFNINFNWV